MQGLPPPPEETRLRMGKVRAEQGESALQRESGGSPATPPLQQPLPALFSVASCL